MGKHVFSALIAGVLLVALLPGTAMGAGPTPGWTRQFGTSEDDRPWNVALDSRRRVAVVGQTKGALPGQTSMGNWDVFVRVFRRGGRLAWTSQFGSRLYDRAYGATVDGRDRVIVVGYTDYALAGHPELGEGDAFVRVYKPNGQIAWTRQFGTEGYDEAIRVAVDRRGRIVVVGFVSGFADDALPRQTSRGGFDAFVRVYKPNGRVVWTRQFGTGGRDEAWGVDVDRNGRIVVAGRTEGVLAGRTNEGGSDAFVRVYKPNGQIAWTRQFGTTADDHVTGAVVDGKGHAVVTGYTRGALPRRINQGGFDAFIRAYGPGGKLAWTRQFGTSSDDSVFDATADGRGRIVLAGWTWGTLQGKANSGAGDAFVRVLRPDGRHAWTRQFGSEHADIGTGVAARGRDRIVATGYTNGALEGMTNSGGEDGFVQILER